MGNCSSSSFHGSHAYDVPDGDDYDSFKEVRALIVHVDYGFEPARSAGWCPAGFGPKLDTPENAAQIKQLLIESGCADITEISNLNATKEEVLAAIDEVGKRCDGNDVFFFFYSGHGDSMEDQDGDEDDGKDEALCLPNKRGVVDKTQGTYLRDDDLAEAFAEVTAGSKMLVFDCCHSGTVCDFDKEIWNGQQAVSICGCRDAQESAAMGILGHGFRGGAFSKCINAGTRTLGNTQVSVGRLFNRAISFRSNYVPPGHQQDMMINCAPGMDPSMMVWPITIPDVNGRVNRMEWANHHP